MGLELTEEKTNALARMRVTARVQIAVGDSPGKNAFLLVVVVRNE
jgi:hypothetical protein